MLAIDPLESTITRDVFNTDVEGSL